MDDTDINYDLPALVNIADSRLNDIVITENQVEKILNGLNINKAKSPDGLSKRLLKNISNSIAEPQTYHSPMANSPHNGNRPLLQPYT